MGADEHLAHGITLRRARRAVVGLQLLLLVCIILWRLRTSTTMRDGVWAAVLCIPLLLPLRGLLRSDRYTYAWATLCVIPYFIVGVTEAIANPQARGWAATCLMISLALFAALIVFIRMTAPPAPA